MSDLTRGRTFSTSVALRDAARTLPLLPLLPSVFPLLLQLTHCHLPSNSSTSHHDFPFVMWSATCCSAGTRFTLPLPDLVNSCSHGYFNSMCLVFPSPSLEAIALVALESVHERIRAPSPKSVVVGCIPRPSAAPVTTALYSASGVLSAREACASRPVFHHCALLPNPSPRAHPPVTPSCFHASITQVTFSTPLKYLHAPASPPSCTSPSRHVARPTCPDPCIPASPPSS